MRGIEQERIRSALEGLIGWLESWRDESGAYNGFVVHRSETKRMRRVHDTAWTQSAMIRGYENLFRKSGDRRWHDAMIRAADLLLTRYDPETGRIRNTGHEDERFQSLVSCALAVRALLSGYDLLDGARKGSYLRAAIDHVKRYWLGRLWVEREGAFRVSETDYYSPGEDRFIVNFNTMAAEGLLALYRRTDDRLYLEYAQRVGEWLLDRWDTARKYNEKVLEGRVTVADDPRSEWMPPGGMPYQFTGSGLEPDNYVVIYTGLSLGGFLALGAVSGDGRFARIAEEQSRFILAMRDPDTRLFYQTTRQGRIEKNPQFIAGAGMTLSGLYQMHGRPGIDTVPGKTVAAILDRSYPNGSYPGFIGKNGRGQRGRDGGGVVWEDAAASVNWNAQLFEYLTLLLEDAGELEVRPCDARVSVATSRFLYRDTPRRVSILSWWPSRSWGIYLYEKKRDKARFSFYPKSIYRTIVSRIRRPR